MNLEHLDEPVGLLSLMPFAMRSTAPAGEPPASAHAPAPPGTLGPACLAAVVDAIDAGAIVVDLQSRLLWANEAARRELRDGEVLHWSRDGVLDVGSAAGSAMLRGALLAAVGGRRQLLPLRTADRLLMVAVQPLTTSPSASPRALLLLGRRQLAPDLLVEMLSQQYDLTAAERRVLVGLLGGRRVNALAREHGVKLSTVRTQVAAIREKLGVQRIDDITRMVAELPPMASALRTGGLG